MSDSFTYKRINKFLVRNRCPNCNEINYSKRPSNVKCRNCGIRFQVLRTGNSRPVKNQVNFERIYSILFKACIPLLIVALISTKYRFETLGSISFIITLVIPLIIIETNCFQAILQGSFYTPNVGSGFVLVYWSECGKFSKFIYFIYLIILGTFSTYIIAVPIVFIFANIIKSILNI